MSADMERTTTFREKTFGIYPTAYEIRQAIKREQIKHGSKSRLFQKYMQEIELNIFLLKTAFTPCV